MGVLFAAMLIGWFGADTATALVAGGIFEVGFGIIWGLGRASSKPVYRR